MKTVNNREEFLKMFDASGSPLAPFTVAEGVEINGLSSVTSLDRVILAEGVRLYDLSSLKSMNDIIISEDVVVLRCSRSEFVSRYCPNI